MPVAFFFIRRLKYHERSVFIVLERLSNRDGTTPCSNALTRRLSYLKCRARSVLGEKQVLKVVPISLADELEEVVWRDIAMKAFFVENDLVVLDHW